MILVAGASGRTGGVVARSLAARGVARVLLRDAGAAAEWRKLGAEAALGALEDATALARALEGASGFFAILPEDPRVPGFREHRLRMADTMAAAVRASGVGHVVLLSAIAASLPEGNGPAAELHHAEQALRDTGARVTALRPCYFQENVLMALPVARAQGIFPCFLPSADAPFPSVATWDVGRIAAGCLLEPPGRSEVVDVLGPVHTTRDLAARLGAALGKELRVVEIPAAAHVDTLAAAGLPRDMAEAVAELYACLASGRVAPRGDRTLAATTPIDALLRDLR